VENVTAAALSATEAARLIREGKLSSEELVRACLARCRAVDPQVQAWAFLDEDFALSQARAADEWKREGNPIGPLHGVPVGIKDIIDTADLPTEHGTVIHQGRRPSRDAAVVSMLRAAGAVIMGKTVTTELATYAPGKTRNPHNPQHTPGGSSSGSAAAVAAGMVPLAVGTQTNGSVIRPAAFCGVYGFKPTYGLIPRHGILKQSPTLDQVGVFASTIDDVALICEQIVGYHEGDPATRPRACIPFCAVAAEEPPITPLIGYIRGPAWERTTEETKEAFAELVERLGDRVEEVELISASADTLEWHRTIMEAEIAANYV
jgi:Asp-tRNA(Asn)/Glu-tRNA(Gln) amidotransferase A subunit family amidase